MSKCKSPYMYKDVIPFGCGQCTHCRIQKKRNWTFRCVLESLVHDESCFVTLTYNDVNLPKGATLNPKHLQDWLKRLRFEIEPKKIRFYATGEYGETNHRPHYHALIFGLGPCLTGIQRCTLCPTCSLVHRTWGMGHTDVGHDKVQSDIAQYVGGYITKKMTNVKNEYTAEWLKGRHPEFARMSLKPGIGALAVENMIPWFESSLGQEAIALNKGDVPQALKYGGKSWPLGRYLRNLIRGKLGIEKNENWMEEVKANHQAQVLELLVKEGTTSTLEEALEHKKIAMSKRHLRDLQKDLDKDLIVRNNADYSKNIAAKEAAEKKRGRKL